METFLSAILKISINFIVVTVTAFLLSSIIPFANTVFFLGLMMFLIATAEGIRFILEANNRKNKTIKMLDRSDSIREVSELLHNDFRTNLRRPYNNMSYRDHILSLFINSLSILFYAFIPFSIFASGNEIIYALISFAAAVPLAILIALSINFLANSANAGVFRHLDSHSKALFKSVTESWQITEASLKFDVKNASFSSLFGLKNLTPEKLTDILFLVDLDKRDKIIKVLQRVKAPEATQTLAQFLKLYPAKNGMAVNALIKSKERAIEPLKSLLQDESDLVKLAAMNTLSGINSQEAIAALVEMLKENNIEIRRAAIWDLNENDSNWLAGESGLRARHLLLRSLTACDSEERAFSAWALGMIKDKDAAIQLKDLLQDSQASVRENAVFALGELRESFVVADIEKSLQDNDKLVRKSALVALRKIAPHRASAYIRENL